MTTLTIWSDFACPYCYIGETRLQRAIDELGLTNDINIDFRAFELDPTAPKEVTGPTPERFAKKYGLSLEDAKKQIDEISNLGRELGIEFNYMTTRYSNTRDAHRLMKLAEDKYDRETVGRLNEALFADYFTKNLVLADRKVLIETAVSVGMDEKEVSETLESDRYDDEVRFDEREAQMRGIRGVPYIVFDGEFAVPGAMTVDGFKSALERVAKRKQQAEAKANENTGSERAHTCGPEGCQLL